MPRIEYQTESLRAQAESIRQLKSVQRQVDALQRMHSLRQHLDALEKLESLQRELESLQKQTEAILQRTRADILGDNPAGERGPGLRSSLINRVKHWLRGSLDRMSDDQVLKVVEAQSPAETIAEILAASPEARGAAESDWAELLLRGAQAKNRIAELAGGLLSSSQAAAVLGISVQALKQRMERHKLLSVPLSGGQWGFPALQFAEGGRVRAGVAEVARAGAPHDPWTVLSILLDDVPGGGGILLERLDDPAVLGDALARLATYGEHLAA